MANYAKYLEVTPQPQTVKDRDDQIVNSAGGYVYGLTDFQALDRFLVLGCENGSYYASEKAMTLKSVGAVTRLLASNTLVNGRKIVDRLVEISEAGRAPKNDPALFVLALCLASDNTDVRRYAAQALPKIARTGTHLFTLVDYVDSLRRWGRSLRTAIGNWYNSKDAKQLALQVCKYQSRTKEGSQTWSHKDVIRKAHVKPATAAHSTILKYVTSGGWSADQLASFKDSVSVNDRDNPFRYIYAHESAKAAKNVDEIVELIERFRLVRESIPTQYLNDKKVWEALLKEMPMNAMIRNLATMTRNGVIGPFANHNQTVTAKLRDREEIKKARVHPINVLSALKTYQSGRSVRGDNTWTPVQSVVDALDDSFYLAFEEVEPTGKRILLAVDCSGSMSSAAIGSMPHLTARDAAAAMALAISKVEPNHHIVGFTNASTGQWAGYTFNSTNRGKVDDGIMDLGISSRMRLDAVINKMIQFPWGGTDCALPMLWAARKNLKVDAFVVITDNETWAGSVKADQALRDYRKQSGIQDAALIVCGTSASNFTIADPKDRRMLDIVGFDSAAPQLISDFIAGRF